MLHRRHVGILCTLGSLLFAASLLACGPKAPGHNGYKPKRKAPWKKARPVSFDEAGELEIDGKVSWAKRRRARWYVFDVPAFGDLELEVRARQIGGKDDEEEFDLAFELLSEKTGKVLVRADKEEDDAGEEKRSRKLTELDAGSYWLHVYLQDRRHAATFTAKLKFAKLDVEVETNFPAEVAFVPNLPAVPPIDDAPPPVKKPKCRGSKCKKPIKKPDEPKATTIRARITGLRSSGGKTLIRIGAGSNRGVSKGSRGRVISKSGAGIPKGSFTVHKVTSTESWASVSASHDAVNAAKYVRITPK